MRFLLAFVGILFPAIAFAQPSGGGGFLPDGGNITQGSIGDTATTPGGTGTISAKLREATSLLNSILTGVTSPIPSPTGTPTEVSVSCGTSSTTFLAASAATQFVMIKVPAGTNTVWFNFAGTAAVQASPSVDIAAGGSLLWGATSYVPTSQINCISASATSVTLLYK